MRLKSRPAKRSVFVGGSATDNSSRSILRRTDRLKKTTIRSRRLRRRPDRKEIETAAREALSVRRWIGDRQLKSLNIAANRPTQKDYDSIAEIAAPSGSVAVI